MVDFDEDFFVDDNEEDEALEEECPKCGATLQRIVSQMVAAGYNKKERHGYVEPESVPVDRVFCERCKYINP